MDNKSLARQKRRRTSKEDEDILKAEYQRNPKPDRATRMDIVRRVALGEKEVQIWFQNKRQNDRRRSQPAQSYDIHSPSNSGIDSQASTTPMSSSAMSDAVTHEDDAQEQDSRKEDSISASTQPTQLPAPIAFNTHLDTNKLPAETYVDTLPMAHSVAKTESQTTDALSYPFTDPRSCETAPTEFGSSQPMPSSQGSTTAYGPRPGYLANRRNASFKFNEDDTAASNIVIPSSENALQSTRSLKRAHSFVRLSTTVDGKARVVTDADQSPSPPRSKPSSVSFARRAASLRRSYSAAGLNDQLRDSSGQMRSPKFARTSIGRSRDSRAWEFWCDPDARNSLTEMADQERSGSAADAIGLIRANSKGPLKPNQNKRNAPLLARQDSTKRTKDDRLKKSRQGLTRAYTSHGRLQTKPVHDATLSEKFKGKAGEKDGEFEIPQTESDKENWEPDDQVSGPYRNRIPAESQGTGQRRQRQVLGENTEILSQSTSLGAMMAHEKRKRGSSKGQAADVENVNPEEDEEIANFMRNGGANSGRTSVSSGEELGCVESLLALSQGNWR